MKKTELWLKDKYPDESRALEQFITPYKQNPNVIGILLTGSYVHSKPDSNSDLDVHIVLKESETRERGNTWINGFEIEYFINPIKQIRYYFETEKGKHTAHMFNHNIILYNNSKEFENLITEAKTTVKTTLIPMTSTDIEIAKYFLDDLKKDLEDVLTRDDPFAFHMISISAIDMVVKLFMNYHQVLIMKSKQLQKQILSLDLKFEKLISDYFKQTSLQNKYHHLMKMISYIEKLIGGSRPKEWSLVTRCPYLDL